MKGLIFDIQKFSVNDGPGIRSTVFFKGCPLRCIWCHNPESKKAVPEIFYNAKKCTLCRKCAEVCPVSAHVFENNTHTFLRDKCQGCSECVKVCHAKALEAVGKSVTAQEVIKELITDKPFYETSGGGVTLSGGEPMYQFEFAEELLTLCRAEGLHTAMETCGMAPSESFRKIAPLVDLFLFDYKLTDPEEHKKYTGASNELILKNLELLDEMGSQIILRCPIIPGINDTEEHFSAIAKLANSLKNILEINVEPYHSLGSHKAEKLGVEYALEKTEMPEGEIIERWIDTVSKKTTVPVKKA